RLAGSAARTSTEIQVARFTRHKEGNRSYESTNENRGCSIETRILKPILKHNAHAGDQHAGNCDRILKNHCKNQRILASAECRDQAVTTRYVISQPSHACCQRCSIK